MITPRDLDILASLCQVRYLAAQHVEWLHWDCALDPVGLRRAKSSRVYARLHQLRAEGYVTNLVRPVAIGRQYKRDMDCWAITQLGLDFVRDHRIIPDDAVSEVSRERSYLAIEHSIRIGQFFAAFGRALAAAPQLQLIDWRADYQLHRPQYHDRVAVLVPTDQGGTVWREQAIIADATFGLQHEQGVVRCFVEIDRERSLRSWRDKVRGYAAYLGTPELQARYGTNTFQVLTVTEHDAQIQRMCDAVAELAPQQVNRFLFLQNADMIPRTINTWQRIHTIQPLARPRLHTTNGACQSSRTSHTLFTMTS